MKLGQTIIGIRKEYGMTQEEFAERFYVTRQNGLAIKHSAWSLFYLL